MLPKFTAKTGIAVRVVALGTGQARGDGAKASVRADAPGPGQQRQARQRAGHTKALQQQIGEPGEALGPEQGNVFIGLARLAAGLAPLGRGTVIFTGASGSLRGRPRFAAFNATKGGLRLMVQSMAREFGPQGLHVAHVIIDGGIEGERLLSRMPDRKEKAGPDGLLGIEAIVENYWHIHRQPRSAWTHELDIRPYKETF